jgi:carboxylesterase type B
MGQSSGATSVLALVSSPLSLDLFQSAISLSGSPNITMDLRTAQVQNAPIVSLLHCSAADGYPTSSSRLACLRALSTQVLATSIPSAWGIPGMNGLPLSPHGQGYAGLVVVDGVLLPLPVQEALKEGVIDVPLLLGNMAQEVDPWPGNEVEALSAPEWQMFLRRWFVGMGLEGGREGQFWGILLSSSIGILTSTH